MGIQSGRQSGDCWECNSHVHSVLGFQLKAVYMLKNLSRIRHKCLPDGPKHLYNPCIDGESQLFFMCPVASMQSHLYLYFLILFG